jgi:hypothetical protein
MNTTMLKTARRLWCVGHADRATQRRNMRSWVRSVRQLGSRWVMAKQEKRLAAPVQEGQISSLVLPFPMRTARSLGEAYEARRKA